ncbi:MAG: D-alanyl-D-alanine carboxypeptidase (penicillin-binding protein 5/6) [Halioglobus sp.]|jgi:D-alanyl-D-alanine carboxypeptidase (penicillin-binding protein 5/6)
MVPIPMTRLFLALLLSAFSFTANSVNIVPSPPQVSAKAYILIDANSGVVLAEKNADITLPPASLTKLMTSYVLSGEISAGRVKDTDMVVVSRNAWSQNPLFNGSSLMWIEPGMDVSISDLKRGVIISSGNDATVAVAEHLAGSVSAFADMMNGTAVALGMDGTHYVNPHGLPDPNHITTARDLAILAIALIQNFPEEYKVYKEREFTYNNIRQYNRNTLLAEDPSVDGLKTGYTKVAGYGMVTSAKRRDMRLVAVVLGTKSANTRKSESRSLLNYGFRFFETLTYFSTLEELEKPRIWKGQQDYLSVGVRDEVVLTLQRGKKKHLNTVVEVDKEISAPVALGDKLGTVKLMLDGDVVEEVPLVALEAVEPGNFFARLWDVILMWISSLFSV